MGLKKVNAEQLSQVYFFYCFANPDKCQWFTWRYRLSELHAGFLHRDVYDHMNFLLWDYKVCLDLDVDWKVAVPGQSFHLSCKISTFTGWIGTFKVSRQCIQMTGDLLTFPSCATMRFEMFVFLFKYLDNYWMDCREVWFRRSLSPEDEL